MCVCDLLVGEAGLHLCACLGSGCCPPCPFGGVWHVPVFSVFLRLVVKVGGGSIVLAGPREAGSLSGSVMAWPWVAVLQDMGIRPGYTEST